MCWPALREIEAASGRQRVIQDTPCKIEAGAGSATSFVATAYARTTGMAFLTHRFREAGGFDETLAVSEDRELVFRLLAAGNSCCSVSEALVNFYVHSGPRLSTSDNLKRQAECDTRILDRHRVFLLKHPKLASRFLNLVAARQRRAGMTADYRRTLLMLLSVRPFDLRAIRRLLVSYLKP